MKQTDLIFVNVVGVNGTTRNQRTVSKRFDGSGVALDDKGQADHAQPALVGVPGDSAASQAPQMDMAAFNAIRAKGISGIKELQQFQLDYAKQVKAWEESVGGGNENLQLANAVLAYCEKYEDFHQEDGNWFVLKRDNIEVVSATIGADGSRTMYTVTGKAVFGA